MTNRVLLGRSGLSVSRLCFGAGPQGPTSPPLTAGLLIGAFELGVNMWDTGADYGTYPMIKDAASQLPRDQIVISTKTYATNADQVTADLHQSLTDLELDYVDILHLHCVPFLEEKEIGHGPGAVLYPFGQRLEALEALLTAKQAGMIRAIGLSTHSVKVVETVARDFTDVDVIFATLNPAGFKIDDGPPSAMHNALRTAQQAGIGVVAIKVLAFGMLAGALTKAFDFAAQPHVHVLNIGMRCRDEVKQNLAMIVDRAGLLAD